MRILKSRTPHYRESFFLSLFVFAIVFAFSVGSFAADKPIRIATTIPDLRDLAAEIAGTHGEVTSISKGTQDPHYIEAKPSFMPLLNRADLLISIGLELEDAWLDNVIRGARNPNLTEGSKGRLIVGPLVDPVDAHRGSVSRSEGDIHPQGNPHVTLDPIRAARIAALIAERLSELKPDKKNLFTSRAKDIESRFSEKVKTWKKKIDDSGVKKVVTYHKTLDYFLNRFGIESVARLEPKPGIPPTSSHVLNVIKTIQTESVPLILIENYFDAAIAKKITGSAPTVRVVTVPVSVDGHADVSSLDELYEFLVSAITAKATK